jgi:hypothetical protein
MDAKELRIGNYYAIALEDGIHYPKIEELKINEFGNYSSNGHNLELAAKPIPLTEEWLFKFGFLKGATKDFNFNNLNCRYGKAYIFCNHLLNSNFRSTGIAIEDEHENQEMSIGLNNIEYVHQLQNLYFALTGEEL